MGVGCTLLYSEIPPSLVTGNRAICVNILDIVILVGWFLFFFFSLVFFSFFFFLFFFFNQRVWSLRQHRLFAAPDISKFSGGDRNVSAGRCWNRFGYLSHCLVCGIPEGKNRTPLFHPPQTCFNPNCCLLCYLNLHGCKWRLWRFSTNSTETCFLPVPLFIWSGLK